MLGVEEEEAEGAELLARPATAELKAAGAISADVVKAIAVVGVPELLLPKPTPPPPMAPADRPSEPELGLPPEERPLLSLARGTSPTV